MISGIISAITQTFTGVATAFGTMILNLFTSLFVSSGTEEGLSAIGQAGVVFFAIGMIVSVLGTVLGILKIRNRKRGSRRYKRARA